MYLCFCLAPDVTHTCESVCHLGECPPCTKSTLVSCRCGRSSVEKPCADRDKDGEFLCTHVCNKKKSCSRHRCNVRCCKVSVSLQMMQYHELKVHVGSLIRLSLSIIRIEIIPYTILASSTCTCTTYLGGHSIAGKGKLAVTRGIGVLSGP